MTTLLLIIGWLGCGVVACGWAFSYLQRIEGLTNRDEWFLRDRFVSGILLWCGLAGLFLVWLNTFGHVGWLWPWSTKAKREVGL